MFFLDEKVVYPGHGVAKITRIVEKRVGGQKLRFYELSFLNKDMTVLVPTENIMQAGLRGLSTIKNIKDIVQMRCVPSKKDIHELTSSKWHKR